MSFPCSCKPTALINESKVKSIQFLNLTDKVARQVKIIPKCVANFYFVFDVENVKNSIPVLMNEKRWILWEYGLRI